MHINPKKSWHVFSDENVTKVLRDEANAREEEAKKQRQILAAEQEVRLTKMRQRAAQRRLGASAEAIPAPGHLEPPSRTNTLPDLPPLPLKTHLIKLDEYVSLSGLVEADHITMEALKQELLARGMKCSGTRMERCQRIFKAIEQERRVQRQAQQQVSAAGTTTVAAPADATPAAPASNEHPLVAKKPTKHLNLFEAEEAGTAGPADNPEYMADKKAEEKKWDDQITTYVGQGSAELTGVKPFYLRADTLLNRIMAQPDVVGSDDSDPEDAFAAHTKAEAESMLKLSREHAKKDPLVEMNALLGRDTDVDSLVHRPAPLFHATSIPPDAPTKPSVASPTREPSHRKRRRRGSDDEEDSDGGGRGGDASDSDGRGRKDRRKGDKKRRKEDKKRRKREKKKAKQDAIEQMRQERREREQRERERAKSLFSGPSAKSAPAFESQLGGSAASYSGLSGYAHFTGGIVRSSERRCDVCGQKRCSGGCMR